jgi:Flp pilus assembly CpaF family ATPase
MNKSYDKIKQFLTNKEIEFISVMNNKVWISSDNENFKETDIELNDVEIDNLINTIFSESGRKIDRNEWKHQLFTPNGFITHICYPTILHQKIVITLYKRYENYMDNKVNVYNF